MKTSGKVTDAIKEVGIYQWPRFIADAVGRARDPATVAAIEKSRKFPDPARDAVQPVYPLETAIGIGAAGVAGGVGAAARAVGGAILRQFVPGSRSPANGAASGGSTAADKPLGSPIPTPKQGDLNAAAERPPISRQKQDGHIAGTSQNLNRVKQGKLTSTFDGSPAEADALTQEAWQKGTPKNKDPKVRDYDFGRRIGTGGFGGGQSNVRVHQDTAGRIHGYPVGRETP